MHTHLISRFRTRILLLCAAALLATNTARATPKPDALLSVDQNRSAIVEKIVSAWKAEISAAQVDSFKSKLAGLRADHLLAANLSGSFDGVLEVMNAHESGLNKNSFNSIAIAVSAGNEIPAAQNSAFLSNLSQKMGLQNPDQSKALGDANADLVYTPLTPCRLFDTRAGLTSALGTVGGTFSNQQRKSIVPAGACGIPTTGVASLFFSFHAYNNNPSTLGVIGFMKPGAPFSALAATWTGAAWATGTFISSSDPNGNFDAFVGNGQAMTADMIVDVVGYFRAPSGALPGGSGGTVTNVATGAGLTGGPITSTGTINLAATQLLPTTACAANQIAKWNGSAWACAADATGSGGAANAWAQGGNSFGAAGSIGTLDAQDMRVVTNGTNVSVVTNQNDGLRISRASNATYNAPNTVNGSYLNSVTAGRVGGTVAGGGTDTLAAGAGDFPNSVTGDWGTVSGGVGNAAGDRAAVGGGFGNVASGQASAIPGGGENQATGQFSFAGGFRANAGPGMFVWSDSTGPYGQGYTTSAQPNSFLVKATGGFEFRTSTSPIRAFQIFPNGAVYTSNDISASGNVYANSVLLTSDRFAKSQIVPIKSSEILTKVIQMPIASWIYSDRARDGRHIGPMAQDFYRAFNLGNADTMINTIDAQGVAFAAIQGLNQKLQREVSKLAGESKSKDAKISSLEKKVSELDSLKVELAAIKKKLGL